MAPTPAAWAARCVRIDDLGQHTLVRAGVLQRLDDDVGIPGGSGGSGVRRVGEHDRASHPPGLRDRLVERDL